MRRADKRLELVSGSKTRSFNAQWLIVIKDGKSDMDIKIVGVK